MATACGWSCYHPHLSSLHQVREHDNHPTLPVVHHLPEVPGSGLHGALGDDEGPLVLVALGEESHILNAQEIGNTFWLNINAAVATEMLCLHRSMLWSYVSLTCH